MKRNIFLKLGIIVGIISTIIIIVLPNSIKSYFGNNLFADWLKEQKLHLGLDLQGGTQLDYKIDLRQAEAYNKDDDKDNDVNIKQLIEGVRTTLERRVNNLGVSEPQIYTSSIAGESHIIVELAGIKDLDEAKATVGKTIQLEFKELKEKLDPQEKDKIRINAEKTLKKIKKDKNNFDKIAEETSLPDGSIEFINDAKGFKDELAPEISSAIWDKEEGYITTSLIESVNGYFFDGTQAKEKTGFFIIKTGKKEKAEREITEPGEDFLSVAKEVSEEKEISLPFYAREDFPIKISNIVFKLNKGDTSDIIETEKKFLILKIADKQNKKEEIRVSHILISYTGSPVDKAKALRVDRDKEEAKALAENVLGKIKSGEKTFDDMVKDYSDDPATRNKGGDLGYFNHGDMVPNFEAAAYTLKTGDISDIVETPFGFHIIKKTDEKPPEPEKIALQRISVFKTSENAREKIEKSLKRISEKKVKRVEDKISYNAIFFSTVPNKWKETGLDGRHFKRATVAFDNIGNPYIAIEFDSEGGKLFEQITERNIKKPLAIFVGGVEISAPIVQQKISGGNAQITGRYTIKEASDLAQDLNTGAIPAPIILSGQYTIGATLGHESLNKSMRAGILGLILVGIYMMLYYRLLGLIADIALIIYAVFILFTVKASFPIAAAALIGIIIFMVFLSEFSDFKESGAVSFILSLSAGIVLSIAAGSTIVLTLAGMAGIILSIGMAVDANILIFERMKEELAEGKPFDTALDIGFKRAWSSIRDSNLSSLLTCAILFWFGSSIIRGFALTLSIGILISMLTAISITRTILSSLSDTFLVRSRWLLGVKKNKKTDEKV